MERFKEQNGDLIPATDLHGYNSAINELPDVDLALRYCGEKRIAVQAGGNCGVWPKYLGTQFKYVYTFEPEPDNFYCLCHNAPERNIFKYQAALGDGGSPVGIKYHPKNGGGNFVEGDGIIPNLSLDHLQLPCCDFLQLDIEGYEYFALQGAMETIRKFSPVIMIEHKKHALRYEKKPEDILELVTSFGYKEVHRIKRDIIFVRENA